MAADLEAGALDVISESIYDMKTLDIRAFREAVQDQVSESLDSHVTYYSDCMDVISRYESHPAAELDGYLADTTYKADE